MYLYLSLGSPLNGRTGLRFYSSEIETHMEIINQLKASGHLIQTAVLMDSTGHRTKIPLDAFDGTPVAYPMRKLQKVYQALLSRAST